MILNALLLFLHEMFIRPAMESLSRKMVLIAVLSLTLLRIAPVGLALSGAGLRWQTKLFAGWLGPRGVAAIVLGVIFILDTNFIGIREIIALIVFATVLLSVFVHGASGVAVVGWYGRFAQALPDDAAEKQAVSALPSYRIPLR